MPNALDPDAVEAFVDAYFADRNEETLPGITISIVENDDIVFLKGYGFADIANARGVDADQTLFRVASITKTFTGAAALQASEKGLVNFDKDINAYLRSIGIPQNFAQPITLRHLLNHRSGYDNYNIGRQARTLADHPPLSKFLNATLEAPHRPPDEAIVYSNHGLALAGLVVAEAADTNYHDLVQQWLLGPLEMSRSGFYLSDELKRNLAIGYTMDGDRAFATDYIYWNTVPASALHTTARDIANYMMMYLNEGRFKERQVLAPASLKRIFDDPAHRLNPAVPTYNYTWSPRFYGRHRGWRHGGDLLGFSSGLVLFPAQGVGVFISVNSDSDDADSVTDDFIHDFAKAWFGSPASSPAPPAPIAKDTYKALEGAYRAPRFSQGVGVLAIVDSLSQTPIYVRAARDGGVRLQKSAKPGDDDALYVEIAENTFRSVDAVHSIPFGGPLNDSDVIGFTLKTNKAPAYLHNYGRSYAKLSWRDGRIFQSSALGLVLLLSLLVGVVGVFQLVGRSSANVFRAETALAVVLVGTLLASFIGPLAYLLLTDAKADGFLFIIAYGPTVAWRVLETLPYVSVAALAVLVFMWVRRRLAGATNTLANTFLLASAVIAGAGAIGLYQYWLMF